VHPSCTPSPHCVLCDAPPTRDMAVNRSSEWWLGHLERGFDCARVMKRESESVGKRESLRGGREGGRKEGILSQCWRNCAHLVPPSSRTHQNPPLFHHGSHARMVSAMVPVMLRQSKLERKINRQRVSIVATLVVLSTALGLCSRRLCLFTSASTFITISSDRVLCVSDADV